MKIFVSGLEFYNFGCPCVTVLKNDEEDSWIKADYRISIDDKSILVNEKPVLLQKKILTLSGPRVENFNDYISIDNVLEKVFIEETPERPLSKDLIENYIEFKSYFD